VDRLSKSFRVIALDLRGSGDSDRPATIEGYTLERMLADVLVVAEAADAPTFALWGFGRGAAIGRYLATSDRVTAAVLVGAPMGPPVTDVIRGAMISMRNHWEPLLKAKQAGTLDLDSLSPGERATLAGDTPITALALGALVDYPQLDPAEIKVPTLWVVGSEDAALAANAREYESRLAGTPVTLKIRNGESYTDCFAKSTEMLATIEPFLAAHREGW
jgi:pimeloyl-ACP methyl ester carboxylesterase